MSVHCLKILIIFMLKIDRKGPVTLKNIVSINGLYMKVIMVSSLERCKNLDLCMCLRIVAALYFYLSVR